MNSYEIYEQLIKEKGITSYRVAKDTGIKSQTFTRWKKGISTPKADKMKTIAEYLGVTEKFLYGEEGKDIAESAELAARIVKDTELFNSLKKYFSSDDVTKKKIINIINTICEE